MRKNEQLIGAAMERKAILRKLRRVDCLTVAVKDIIDWLLKRCERYDRAQGGLGRKRKGV